MCVASRNPNSYDLVIYFNNANELSNELMTCWGTLMEGSHLIGKIK